MKTKKLVTFTFPLVFLLFLSVFPCNYTFSYDTDPFDPYYSNAAQDTQTPSYYESPSIYVAPPETTPQGEAPHLDVPETSPVQPDPPVLNQAPPSQDPPAPPRQHSTPKVDATEKNSLDITKTTDETKPNEEKNEEDPEKEKKPDDLPEVESDEILFPEVIASSENSDQKPKNLLAGIIAWTCIILGIAIVIFVLIKGKNKGDIEPKALKVRSSGHKKKNKRLLDDKYYKNR